MASIDSGLGTSVLVHDVLGSRNRRVRYPYRANSRVPRLREAAENLRGVHRVCRQFRGRAGWKRLASRYARP